MYIPHIPPYRTLLPILPYTILSSRLYPKSISSYPLHTFNIPRFSSINILFHSTLSYSSYPTLNYFTIPLLKLDRNDSWQKRLVLLGQIDLPSGDKAARLGGSDSWPKIYQLFSIKSFWLLEISAPDLGPQTFQHQEDSVPNL